MSKTTDYNKFFKDSKLLDDNGQPVIFWHGSKTNALTEFDSSYDGSGVVTMSQESYGGFFFASVKDAAEYYCYGGVPEEKIENSNGEIYIETYGENEEYFYIVSKLDSEAYNEDYEQLVADYKIKNGENAD